MADGIAPAGSNSRPWRVGDSIVLDDSRWLIITTTSIIIGSYTIRVHPEDKGKVWKRMDVLGQGRTTRPRRVQLSRTEMSSLLSVEIRIGPLSHQSAVRHPAKPSREQR